MLQLRIDDQSLMAATGRGWSEITLVDHFLGGCWEASWQMSLPPGYKHQLLERGRTVEVLDGPVRTFKGISQAADYAGGRFTALGLWRDAANYPALDGSGAMTSVPNTAIDAQIAAGLDVTRPASFGGVALSTTDPDDVMPLDELLTLYAKTADQVPYVDADGVISRRAADAEPSWIMVPRTVELGTGDDDYASRVLLRFKDSTAGGALDTIDEDDPDAAARFGTKYQLVDATSLGNISPTTATNLTQGILADGRARPGITNTIEATPWTLLSIGGRRADPALVNVGQKVRLAGLFDNTFELDGRTWLDITVGETSKTWANGRCRSVTITPLGFLPRAYAQVIEKRMAALRDKRLVKY